jgi:hypothetical protein
MKRWIKRSEDFQILVPSKEKDLRPAWSRQRRGNSSDLDPVLIGGSGGTASMRDVPDIDAQSTSLKAARCLNGEGMRCVLDHGLPRARAEAHHYSR